MSTKSSNPSDFAAVKERFRGSLQNLLQHKDIAFAVGILCIIGVLIFPVSTGLLDFLLSTSIAFSVLILMTVLFIDKPLDLSAFPSILLVVTMLRLSLNISTTRLILSNGHKGTDAAGHVVEAFGYFVMQGSVVIGAIVFAILTIINFVVITKGSGRIAEVAARFSLDAMPGKQMSIDADLAAGVINQEQAQQKRKNLESESTFFGSMDGANKFVRGDAIAGLLITFINFVAGIIIGTIQQDMSFDKALKTYTILTIGDGLVTQIPALIVSVSAGLLVTKSGVHGSADKAIFQQLGQYPQSLMISGFLCGFMAIMPGLPAVPLLVVGAIMAGAALWMYRVQKQEVSAANMGVNDVQGVGAVDQSQSQSAAQTSVLYMDTIRLEMGYELLSLVDPSNSLKITDQIKGLRKQLAKEMGFIIPSVRVQDNMQLDGSVYIIKIKEIEVGRGIVRRDKLLIMDSTGATITIPGEDTREPAFGLQARWVNTIYKEDALFKGYTVIEPSTVIITHMTELLKENIIDLLTYAEVQKLVDNLPDGHKRLVNEIIPSQISIVVLQRVLQLLLGEGVSIRDFTGILEAISEISSTTNNPQKLTEHVRMRLAKQICNAHMNEAGYIPVLVLSADWEQVIVDYSAGDGDNKQVSLPPSKLHDFVADINREYEKYAATGEIPVILTSPTSRAFVRKVIERIKPGVAVISQHEIHSKARIKTLGQI